MAILNLIDLLDRIVGIENMGWIDLFVLMMLILVGYWIASIID